MSDIQILDLQCLIPLLVFKSQNYDLKLRGMCTLSLEKPKLMRSFFGCREIELVIFHMRLITLTSNDDQLKKELCTFCNKQQNEVFQLLQGCIIL